MVRVPLARRHQGKALWPLVPIPKGLTSALVPFLESPSATAGLRTDQRCHRAERRCLPVALSTKGYPTSRWCPLALEPKPPEESPSGRGPASCCADVLSQALSNSFGENLKGLRGFVKAGSHDFSRTPHHLQRNS